MINATNNVVQTVQPNQNILFNTNNVISKKCNTCCGSVNHNLGSGIFTLTQTGVYRIHFNANVTNTIALSAITLDITNAGETISGGEMITTPEAIGSFENVSTEVLVRVPCNSSVVITIKNNTPTNPIQVNNPSLIITREC